MRISGTEHRILNTATISMTWCQKTAKVDFLGKKSYNLGTDLYTFIKT